MKNLLLYTLILLTCSCKGKESNDSSDKQTVTTPVTVTTPKVGSIQDSITLNATSIYLLKTDVKATVSGYIVRGGKQLGDPVHKGQILFCIRTKEAQSLGNTINKLTPELHFTGLNNCICPVSGYVVMINHQPGNYVQEGETLATICDRSSFGFMMNLPYELNHLLRINHHISICLPDGQKLMGKVFKIMPGVDSLSQTQQVFLKINTAANIPENLIAKAYLIKRHISNAVTLPKESILTDETQTTFWVMKLINNHTAVRINITKGIENGNRVQIESPQLNSSDRIIVSGNYGLPDTANVVVQKNN